MRQTRCFLLPRRADWRGARYSFTERVRTGKCQPGHAGSCQVDANVHSPHPPAGRKQTLVRDVASVRENDDPEAAAFAHHRGPGLDNASELVAFAEVHVPHGDVDGGGAVRYLRTGTVEGVYLRSTCTLLRFF